MSTRHALRHVVSALSLALLFATLAAPMDAAARRRAHRVTVRETPTGRGWYSGLELKLGGQFGLSGKMRGKDKLGNQSSKTKSDMEATLGVALELAYPVHRYVVVGGQFAYGAWNTEGFDDLDLDRSHLIDISAVLKVRYPFASDRAEVYLRIPIGASIVVMSDDHGKTFQAQNGAATKLEAQTGVGMNFSVLAGFQYRFSQYIGAYLEMGMVYHYMSVESEVQQQGQNGFQKVGKLERTGGAAQFALNFGLMARF